MIAQPHKNVKGGKIYTDRTFFLHLAVSASSIQSTVQTEFSRKVRKKTALILILREVSFIYVILQTLPHKSALFRLFFSVFLALAKKKI